jgi:hypothetical protein
LYREGGPELPGGGPVNKRKEKGRIFIRPFTHTLEQKPFKVSLGGAGVSAELDGVSIPQSGFPTSPHYGGHGPNGSFGPKSTVGGANRTLSRQGKSKRAGFSSGPHTHFRTRSIFHLARAALASQPKLMVKA